MNTRKPPKAHISKKREIRTYVELFKGGSRVLLERAQAEQKGSKWLFAGSLIFMAFSFEAYLNHIGPQICSSWPALKVLSPENKLDVLSEILGIDLTVDKRPRQTIKCLFKFRNEVAHGKTHTIEEKLFSNADHLEKLIEEHPLANWEKYCTEGNALRAREDIEQVMRLIHEKARLENDPLFGFGIYEASATLQQDS